MPGTRAQATCTNALTNAVIGRSPPTSKPLACRHATHWRRGEGNAFRGVWQRPSPTRGSAGLAP
jgi:hypothetical protein